MKNGKKYLVRTFILVQAITLAIWLGWTAPTATASSAQPAQVSVMATVAKKAPVSTHCGNSARWKLYQKKDYREIKVRIWYINNNRMARLYAFEVSKVKPKSKAKVGIDVRYPNGEIWWGSMVNEPKWTLCLAAIPRGDISTMVRPRYENKTYEWYELQSVHK